MLVSALAALALTAPVDDIAVFPAAGRAARRQLRASRRQPVSRFALLGRAGHARDDQRGPADAWEIRPRFAWTPDARRVAVAPRTFDARLRVINVATGRVVRGFSLPGRDGLDDLGAQAMSPDGRFVVFGDDPSPANVRIADVRTGKMRVLVRAATAAAFSREGDRVAVRTAEGVRIVDLSGRTLATVADVGGQHLAWSPDDSRIAVSGPTGEFWVGVIDLTAPTPRLEQRLAPTSTFASPPVCRPTARSSPSSARRSRPPSVLMH